MKGPCVSCVALQKCRKATPEMVAFLEGCGLYEEVAEPILIARVRAIDLLGPDVVTKKKGYVDMAAIGARKHLRAIAVSLGAVSRANSFKMQADDLAAAILTVTGDDGSPVYPDIESMNDDALKELVGALKDASAPAAAAKPARKPRKPRKPAAESEPAVEETPADTPAEEPPAEEPAPAPAKEEKPAARKPRKPRKPAAPRKPRKPAAAAAKEPSADLSLLTEMVKTIGTMVEKQDTKAKDMAETLATLLEKVEAIDAHLAWAYSADADEGNEIESLTEISWT